MFTSFLLLGLLLTLVSGAYQEAPCTALGGQCQVTSNSCPGAYQSGKCPTQPGNVKCCTAKQESRCSSAGGLCQFSVNPCSGSYVSGYCPTQPSAVRCCVGSVSSSISGSCSSKAAACAVKNHALSRFYGTQFDSRGANDGADAKSNIRDACNGQKAKRSSYGTAPGGSVCLQNNMLTALKALLDASPINVQVNCFAGASHASNSKHYYGRAFDLQSRYVARRIWMDIWVATCRRYGATVFHRENARGHDGHVHCEFPA